MSTNQPRAAGFTLVTPSLVSTRINELRAAASNRDAFLDALLAVTPHPDAAFVRMSESTAQGLGFSSPYASNGSFSLFPFGEDFDQMSSRPYFAQASPPSMSTRHSASQAEHIFSGPHRVQGVSIDSSPAPFGVFTSFLPVSSPPSLVSQNLAAGNAPMINIGFAGSDASLLGKRHRIDRSPSPPRCSSAVDSAPTSAHLPFSCGCFPQPCMPTLIRTSSPRISIDSIDGSTASLIDLPAAAESIRSHPRTPPRPHRSTNESSSFHPHFHSAFTPKVSKWRRCIPPVRKLIRAMAVLNAAGKLRYSIVRAESRSTRIN